jgi:hypothetical protein
VEKDQLRCFVSTLRHIGVYIAWALQGKAEDAAVAAAWLGLEIV